MTRLIPFLLITTVFLLTSCQTFKEKRAKKKSETNEAIIEAVEETTSGSYLENSALKSIVIDKTYQWPGSTDVFNFSNLKVSGDTLIISVEYGGGCKEHGFKMNTTSVWMKSMPPKLNLWLEHENKDDNCRALIMEEMRFDLKPVRYAGSRSIFLILNGEEEKAVEYRY